jgi:hypothetical protein
VTLLATVNVVPAAIVTPLEGIVRVPLVVVVESCMLCPKNAIVIVPVDITVVSVTVIVLGPALTSVNTAVPVKVEVVVIRAARFSWVLAKL